MGTLPERYQRANAAARTNEGAFDAELEEKRQTAQQRRAAPPPQNAVENKKAVADVFASMMSRPGVAAMPQMLRQAALQAAAPAQAAPRAQVGRNDPCPCGSGKKYKKCCGRNNP